MQIPIRSALNGCRDARFLNPNEFLRSMYIIKRNDAIDVVQMKSHLDGGALLNRFYSSKEEQRVFLDGNSRRVVSDRGIVVAVNDAPLSRVES